MLIARVRLPRYGKHGSEQPVIMNIAGKNRTFVFSDLSDGVSAKRFNYMCAVCRV
jgi:hypothetical protein